MRKRLPIWLKNKNTAFAGSHSIKKLLRDGGLNSVCEEAKCPNLCECFSKGTSTFMILGNVCTRNCKFCAVTHGRPENVDISEPVNIANLVAKLKLKHAVITSVTRDDLNDGGSNQFALTIEAIRNKSKATIEVLTPDFQGNLKFLDVVLNEQPDIFNHNVETIERLTSNVRDKMAKFQTSIDVLKHARQSSKCKIIKSGFMVGLGESASEVKELILILKNAGVNLITIGQYLQPLRTSIPVSRFVHPDEFNEYNIFGKQNEIEIFSGPLVRSSYNAGEALHKDTSRE